MPFPNLSTQFGKNNNANPTGRPKGQSIRSLLRDLLDQTELGGKPLPGGMTIREAINLQLAKAALKGDLRAIVMVYEQTEGKVPVVVQAEVQTTVTPSDADLDRMLASLGYVPRTSQMAEDPRGREGDPGGIRGDGERGPMDLRGCPTPRTPE